MGVRDLLQWVKSKHPEAIVTYPSRWASPEFKGKKIAIDATLLTNRYHFASKEGPLKEKGEILGWYNLISEMRAHGIKPVAIWDERGPREWKASEARRRLTVRAGHLIRHNREIERSSRLHHLREVLHDFNAMPEEEQGIVRAHWEMTRFMFMRPKQDLEQDSSTHQIGSETETLEGPASRPGDISAPPSSIAAEAPGAEQPVSPPAAEPTQVNQDTRIAPSKRSTSSLTDIATGATGVVLAPVIFGVAAVADAVLKSLPSASTTRTKSHEPVPPPLPPKPESITGGPNKSSQLASTLSEADDATIDRITSMIDSLAPLIQEYRDARRLSGYGYKEQLEPDEMSMILSDGVVEMAQDLREEWIVSPPVAGPAEGAEGISDREKGVREREERVEEIDETLAGLISPDKVPETPSQMALTKAEGEIINDILSPPSSPSLSSSAESASTFVQDGDVPDIEAIADPSSYRTPSSAEMESEPDLPEPLERLDALIEALPSVRGIYERALNLPSAADHEDCKELLLTMGVPVLEAKIPYEAEGLASALARRGLVDFVGSEDSDVLAYEGPLLRHLSPATKPLSLISGVKLRQLTGLTSSQYLDFLILLGTDASPRIPKIGPVTAFKLIKKHGSIERILEEEKAVKDRVVDFEGFMEMVNNARKVFTKLPPTERWEAELLEESDWDEGEVERLLEEKHGIRLVEVEVPARQE
ncbi:hypothetical protein IAT40_000593 [Kwoniella sp. CBS 6097]